MQEFFSAISNFGFPVVVAGYLLFRFENKIDKLDKTVTDNTQSTMKLVETIKSLSEQMFRIENKK